MPKRTILPVSWVVCFFAIVGGCIAPVVPGKKSAEAPITMLPYVAGTVGEYAVLAQGGYLSVQGYGVVVGLGTNGSAEVPPTVKKYLIDYLSKKGLGQWSFGTQVLPPSRILRDLDTAVVSVTGSIPPGAPTGSWFDVFLSALPQTQTRSIEGGVLMLTELRRALQGFSPPGKGSKVWALAAGPIFVNPFIDPTDPAEVAKLRTGRVIRGGRVKRDRLISLQLRESNYARCALIQRRINERFPSSPRIANARTPSSIELRIPQAYRDDYEHFLELVLHLPLQSGAGAAEAHANRIAVSMGLPVANHRELALVWEAMGRQVVPIIKQLYTSENIPAAFYAARAGLRLGDDSAADVIMQFATSSNSPLQIPAIEELGRHRRLSRTVPILQRLIDDESELVRIAAYEALLKYGDRSFLTRIDISGQFTLDMVKSGRSYVVYATQTGEPRVVLFGKDMMVSRPIFFNSPDDLLTVNARSQDEKLMLFRKIPRTGGYSDAFYTDFFVRTLVKVLGSAPEPGEDGKIGGLGLTYGQVIGVLYRMCKEGGINAKFVLQPSPGVQRIYQGAVTAGRPDMPE